MCDCTISVLMPVYNTKEEYLRTAVESILQQTRKDFEFIILDDGSEKNIRDIIHSYSDPRIVYLNFGHLGLPKQLNLGIDRAKGKYIARMDADDISLPERFEKQVDFLETHPEITVLGTDLLLFPEEKIITHLQYPGFFDLLGGTIVGYPTVMWRRDDFERYGLRYDENCICAQDYDLWSRAIRYVKFANLPEVLLKYRLHEGQVSSSKQNIQIQVTEKVRQNMLDFLTQDEDVRKKLLKFAICQKRKKCVYEQNFWQRMFSIKNCYFMGEKFKKMVVCGRSFIFRQSGDV